MYQYRQVLLRMRQGDSDREIARSGLMGRPKAAAVRAVAQGRGWLEPAVPLPDDAVLAQVFTVPPRPASCISTLEPFRRQLEQWLRAGIQGTTIHRALCRDHGFTGSYSAVRRFVQAHAAAQPVATTMRLDFAPGDAVQVDFGAGPAVPHPRTGEVLKSWFFVMTLCWSRHQYAELVLDQSVATWLGCHRRAFEWFGGVPARVIIDNPKCAITRACYTDPTVQRAYAECAEGYGFRISPCPPRDPQKKGIVEAGVKYIKRAFVPLRTFRDLTDANRQLAEWVRGEAGVRCHGTTREQPLKRFVEVEQALLQPLPDVAPELAVWAQASVHGDAHVQFEKALYSVPFRLIGQRVWLKATAGLVQVFDSHVLVATHPRAQRPGQRSTLADHLPPEAQAWSLADPQHCLACAEAIGPCCRRVVESLFADRVLDKLRAAQGVLRLAKRHGNARLEAACARALAFGDPRYRTIKTILARGLDQHPDGAAEPAADNALYARGGRFCRTPSSRIH
ncbi:IS21 family transposase [Dokdonella sp.]|uniref:IS21 family transposase n=1 Tax=Dokdonella sp. TaxID=2291710 RepID=UPI0031CAB513|nr:IS21 family transposase [Dokdonella sp.]